MSCRGTGYEVASGTAKRMASGAAKVIAWRTAKVTVLTVTLWLFMAVQLTPVSAVRSWAKGWGVRVSP